ncbi:MAG: ABC transporter substrate-binding protein [Alphaproteobacteria bacterium]
MAKIRIMFTRFSAFYSPLILTGAAGFLQAEGLEPEFSIAGPGQSPRGLLESGALDLIQSAVYTSWLPLEKGEVSDIVHFAQVNERDGFFIASRKPEPDFGWDRLKGRKVLVDHGGQPLAMFKYACEKAGVDYAEIDAVDAGPDMLKAFRDGIGDYVHLQGPGPQQMERDGVGHIVAQVGPLIGKVAFSSLAATRAWLTGEMAHAFARAYTRARRYVNETPAAEIARVERDFFKDIDPAVLTATVATYQKLGNWNPSVAIDREGYEVALDVFLQAGLITRRHDFDLVIAPPPSID